MFRYFNAALVEIARHLSLVASIPVPGGRIFKLGVGVQDRHSASQSGFIPRLRSQFQLKFCG